MTDYVLGGVPLEVVGVLVVPPAQPEVDPNLWATDQLRVNTPIIMLNGAVWRLQRDPTPQEDARYLVEIRQPGRPLNRISLLVPADELSTPIWNTGQPPPSPDPVDPVGEPPVIVDAPPPTPPANPGDPVEAPEEPLEPLEPPD